MTVKLKRLSTWAEYCGLGVNSDKTELVLFSRRYKIPSLIPPRLKNSVLFFSNNVNYFQSLLSSLNFGFSSVFIRVYKSDAPAVCSATDRPVEEDITSEIEAPEHPELERYMSDASTITRDLKNLWQAGDMELTPDVASDDEDANATVVEQRRQHGSKPGAPPISDKDTVVLHAIRPEGGPSRRHHEKPYTGLRDTQNRPYHRLRRKCSPWGSTNINVRDRKEVIDLTLASHEIHDLIKDWNVSNEHSFSDQAVLILNKESLAPIDAVGGELNFGFSSVFIRVYKSDAPAVCSATDRPVEEDITSEIEAPEHPELEGYTSDASTITRDLKNLWQAGEMELTSDVASDDEDANATVVEQPRLLFYSAWLEAEQTWS
ncbi:hypothetical protein ACLKA6_005818 [Drosophila palustris]